MNGIRYFRKKNHMTQTELANVIGVTQTSVSQWESGRNYPDIKTAKRLADIFGATLDQILGSDDMTEEDLRLAGEPFRLILERSDDMSDEDALLLDQKIRLIELMDKLSPLARTRVLDRAEIFYEVAQLQEEANKRSSYDDEDTVEFED
ncbi:MAG TPA: helix-turn-helix transcriptional regulator [Clostridiaceae bacterium]|nr:helix-turn-helix transcriptional regulator [Clostridiaceae bacterium]